MSRTNECKELPPVEYLRECFDYNPETGSLVWRKDRPRDHFQTESKWKQYQTQRAGREAGCRHLKKNGEKAYIQVGMFNVGGRVTVRTMLMVSRICAAIAGLAVTKDVFVDHKDGDIWNHKKDNLRLASVSQNGQNCKPHSDRKHMLPRGVFQTHKGKNYTARITLGSYPTPELAAEAVRKAAALFHGEFARFD